MSTFLAFIVICLLIYMAWLVASLLWRAGQRKSVMMRIGLVLVLFVPVVIGFSKLADRDAINAGFENAADKNAASAAGVKDAAQWAAMREDMARQKVEAEKAEADRLADEQAKKARKAEADKLAAIEAERKSQADKLAAEEACRKDVQCWGDKGWVAATSYCPDEIVKLAKWDFEWTDKWSETKFDSFRWKNQKQGIVTYLGDKLKLQNGFGAWKHVRYSCDFDPVARLVLGVRIIE